MLDSDIKEVARDFPCDQAVFRGNRVHCRFLQGDCSPCYRTCGSVAFIFMTKLLRWLSETRRNLREQLCIHYCQMQGQEGPGW